MKTRVIKGHLLKLIFAIIAYIIFDVVNIVGLQIERSAVNYFYEELGSKDANIHFSFLKFFLLFITGYLFSSPIDLLLGILVSYSTTRWTLDSNNDLRVMLLERISKLSPKKLEKHFAGNKLLTLVWNDSNTYVNKIISIPTTIVTTTINILSNFFFLFYNSLVYSLIMLLLLPISQIFTLITYRINKKYRLSVRRKSEDFRNSVKNALNNFYCLFAFKKEEILIKKINSRFTKINNEEIKWDLVSDSFEHLEKSFVSTSINLIKISILFSLVYSTAKGGISFGDLLTFPVVIRRLYWSLNNYSSCYASWKDSKIYKEEMSKIPDSDLKGRIVKIEGYPRIVIKDLSFSYGTKTVLKDINITFEAGKRYAIIGKSGCGKTTLARLLFAYHREYEGRIKINGLEYKKLNQKTIWDTVSHSDSSNFIFLTSLKENINLWDDEEIKEEVLRRAALSEEELPKVEGSDQHALTRFSDGQKQRISLARNFFRDKPIVILDEALANLDKDNINRIKDGMKEDKDKIYIIISHNIDLKDSFYDEIIDLEKINKIK